MLLVACAFLLSFSGYSGHTENPEITREVKIVVENLRSNEGFVRIGVYDDPDHFKENPIYKLEFSKTDIVDGKLVCSFALPEGQYAFALFDDKNSNKEMDRTKMGIPKEGFGFSNNAKVKFFKAPSFQSCQVEVDEVNREWNIKMRYIK